MKGSWRRRRHTAELRLPFFEKNSRLYFPAAMILRGIFPSNSIIRAMWSDHQTHTHTQYQLFMQRCRRTDGRVCRHTHTDVWVTPAQFGSHTRLSLKGHEMENPDILDICIDKTLLYNKTRLVHQSHWSSPITALAVCFCHQNKKSECGWKMNIMNTNYIYEYLKLFGQKKT